MKTLTYITQIGIGLSQLLLGILIAILISGESVVSSTFSVTAFIFILIVLVFSFAATVTVIQYIDKIPRIEELEKESEENWNKYQEACRRLNNAALLIEKYNKNNVETVQTEM